MRHRLIIVLALICLICVIGFFIRHFYFSLNYGVSPDVEHWGQFGDYFGGVLNPILSFLTVILLVRSIDMQIEANKSLNEDLEENKKNEKLRNFESLFFNMLSRQNSSFSLMKIKIHENDVLTEYSSAEAVLKVEEIISEAISEGRSDAEISDLLEDTDETDGMYSQFRCFYLAITFISEYLSENSGFSFEDRGKYYKSLINFTDYSQVRLMAMYLEFMADKYQNVELVKGNHEFKSVFEKCGLSFNLYRKFSEE